MAAPDPGFQGCLIDPIVKEAFWSTLQFDNLMQADPGMLGADDGADVFLFDAEAAYLKTLRDAGETIPWPTAGPNGMYLANHFQKTNDCTSHGSGGAMEDLQMVDIMWRGLAETFDLIASEPLYGGAIVTIMGRRGDNGAYTSAPLAYATKYGFLRRKDYGGGNDFTTYSGNKATEYSNRGVPSTLLDLQKEHELVLQIPVHNFEDGGALLRQGFSIVGGSNQGFSMTRDANGFCLPRGRWAHCTRFRGRRGGKLPGWCYGQSWGPGSPAGPGETAESPIIMDDGRPLILPPGSFFVDPDTINRMIGQGEFYALSKLGGFPRLDYKLF